MIKLPPSPKRENNSLRPLTEKDIQKKLYGALQEGASVGEQTDAPSRLVFERKEKLERLEKKEKKALWQAPPKINLNLPKFKVNLPKVKVSIPWQKLQSVVFKIGKVIWEFAQAFFSKATTVWGMGALVALLLFLGINMLNSYRTAAMKKPKAPIPVEATANEIHESVKEAQLPPAPALSRPGTELSQSSASGSKSAVAGKAYVVQIATYANEKDAEKLTDLLKENGLPSFSQSFKRNTGKVFYLVFLGRFQTFEEAEKGFKQFRGKLFAKNFPDSFIRYSNS